MIVTLFGKENGLVRALWEAETKIHSVLKISKLLFRELLSTVTSNPERLDTCVCREGISLSAIELHSFQNVSSFSLFNEKRESKEMKNNIISDWTIKFDLKHENFKYSIFPGLEQKCKSSANNFI